MPSSVKVQKAINRFKKALRKALQKLSLARRFKKTMTPTGPLAGKLAVVTGSARGIGAAIATKLASSGASVLINFANDSSRPVAEALAAKLRRDYGVCAAVHQADLSDPIKAAPGLIQAAVGPEFASRHTNPKTGKVQIDIIVHNAAATDWTPIYIVNKENFDRHYHCNVLAPIMIQQEATPYLPQDRSGRIVFISSAGVKMGCTETSLYIGTKGAIEAMTKVWAKEIATRATVNVVQPGPTQTELTAAAPDSLIQYLKGWMEHTPLAQMTEEELAALSDEERAKVIAMGGRRATAGEIADIVYLVALPESGWMTGQVLQAAGGMF